MNFPQSVGTLYKFSFTRAILTLWNGYSLVTDSLFFFFLSFQECGDPSAVLWLDEIQDAILRANKDSEEALQCNNPHLNLSFNKNMNIDSFLWIISVFLKNDLLVHLQSLRQFRPLMRLWITRTLLKHWQPCVHLLLVCMESHLNALRPTRMTCFELKRKRIRKVRWVLVLILWYLVQKYMVIFTSNISFFYLCSQLKELILNYLVINKYSYHNIS